MIFFASLYEPREHFSCFTLSSSVYGSQVATFEKNCIFEKYNTFVRLVFKKEDGVKATAVGLLICVFNCLFKSV
jgi:hypothetical protein